MVDLMPWMLLIVRSFGPKIETVKLPSRPLPKSSTEAVDPRCTTPPVLEADPPLVLTAVTPRTSALSEGVPEGTLISTPEASAPAETDTATGEASEPEGPLLGVPPLEGGVTAPVPPLLELLLPPPQAIRQRAKAKTGVMAHQGFTNCT